MRPYSKSQRGFTLVEMIVVIVITGIIGGMVAVFIRAPVQGYADSARRAEMTDIADTALRRIGRDLRTAVPNSVRIPVAAGSTYIEFIPTRDGGRYRVSPTGGGGGCGAAGDDLDFTAPDTCFEIVGSPIAFVAGDQIVVGSTQSDGSLPYKSAAAGGVMRPIAAAGVGGAQQVVKMTSTVAFPASSELDGHRFEVVPADQQAVTYACTGTLGPLDANGDGQGALTRYWAYGFIFPQPVPPLGGSNAVLADKVSACNFVYNTSNVRDSLVAISLTITRGGESVNLYHEIHVNNLP
jgi:MSHA biogenesis protein MshO